MDNFSQKVAHLVAFSATPYRLSARLRESPFDGYKSNENFPLSLATYRCLLVITNGNAL